MSQRASGTNRRSGIPSLAWGAIPVLLVALMSFAVDSQEPAPFVDPETLEAPDVIPADSGRSVRKLVHAQRFSLESSYRDYWCAERPLVDHGYLLVIEIDPAFAIARQVESPVLYVGDRPAELLNIGLDSAHLIVLVPECDALRDVPIYFGSYELPERVDRARGEAERRAAVAKGVRPFGREAIDAAIARGGEPLSVGDRTALMPIVADLIDRYSPTEAETATIYRLNAR